MNIPQPSFQSLRVAALESRRRDDMQRLIERFGGEAFVSPSMREVAIPEHREAVDFAYRVMTGEINIILFLTGVGFKHLLTTIDKHIDTKRFLDALSDITTVARGPKPVAVMREFGLTPTHRVPEPNTWREMLKLIDEQVPVANQNVGVQEYGVTNRSLIAGLEARGATVVPLRVYQWDLPEDIQPLEENLQAIIRGERDLLLITSAHQIVNLFRLAEERKLSEELRSALNQMLVCSIGPTTSEMVQHLQLTVDIEPEHPKMGHLVQASAEKAKRMLDAKRMIGRPRIRMSSDDTQDEPSSSTAPPHPSLDGPFMRACRRQSSSVTPIWLMRQAGRYMAEYREVRQKVGFLDLCKNPALCAEVMVTAVEKLGVDAAIIFSDLLPILEPMGMELEFAAGDGPVIHNPIRTGKDVERVKVLESMDPLRFVADTVTMTRRAIRETIPVIGFAGSPFTLASYMIEGGGSRNYANTKTLMYTDEVAWHELMLKLVESIGLYLNEQILAGAQCVQLFDSWAGCLSPTDYERYVLPYMVILLESIIPTVPVINFATGNPMLITMLRGDHRTVVGLDWRVGLDVGWDMAGSDRAVQGNLEPLVLLGDRATLKREVKRVLDEAQGRAGHIFNIGHGILPQTPVDNAIALVDLVHELSAR